jgi:hypothetical protein
MFAFVLTVLAVATQAVVSATDLENFVHGTDGILFATDYGYAESGTSVAGVGDVDSDGFADFLVGGPGLKTGDSEVVGGAWLVYGNKVDGVNNLVPFGNVQQAGFRSTQFYGDAIGGECGTAVASIGDFNGDTFDDFAIGCPAQDSNRGVTFIVLGNDTLPAIVTLNTSSADFPGLKVFGLAASERSGSTLGGGGDVNNDGYDAC